MDFTQGAVEFLWDLLPIIATAIVAAISAWIKVQIDRRDAHRQTERRLALATARTEFARVWFDTSVRVGGDEAEVARKARSELDDAYMEAQAALDEAKAFERADSKGIRPVNTEMPVRLRRMLALGPYMSRWSYTVSWVLYGTTAVFGLFLVIGLFTSEPADGEAPAGIQAIFGLLYIYVFLRLIAQVPIFGLERNARLRDGEGAHTPSAYPPPPTAAEAPSP